MTAKRIIPATYEELHRQLGDEVAPFDRLFQDAISYFDSLLGQDARSSPGLESGYIDRFVDLLNEANFEVPHNPREILIKLSYGYYMHHQRPSGSSA